MSQSGKGMIWQWSAYALGLWLVGVGLAWTPLVAQPRAGPSVGGTVRHDSIGPGLTLFRSGRGNLLLRLVDGEAVVMGAPLPELAAAVRIFLRGVPPRWAVISFGDSATTFGDAGWARDGALVVTHEALRGLLWGVRVDSTRRVSTRPGVGFSEVIQLSLRGEELHLVHQPRAYSVADFIGHLETADVLYLGPLYRSDGYPALALEAGGRITGLIEVATTFLTNFAGRSTILIPAIGPATTLDRLRAYRDMLLSVRNAVARTLADHGTEQDAIRQRPTKAFDAEWGRDGSADAFVRAVYRSLSKER
ncbi:MAG: hypothetical protein HEQ38_02340 [Gemmatimonas sp.]|nr:hypothetical protein [Gemmatimonas sp.]